MKTFKIEEIKNLIHCLIDKDEFVRFTVYIPKRKPLKVKAKISTIWATPKGYKFDFNHCYVNRKRFFDMSAHTKDIRWIKPPRLLPVGRMLPMPENALLDQLIRQ